jgi:hypothetical protein
MYKFLISALISAASSAALAQTPPPEVSALLGDSAPAGSLSVITKLTAEQRAFFWKDTTRSPDGYLRVQTTPAYLNIVADFRSDARKTAPGAPVARLSSADHLPDHLVYSGSISEDETRSTLVFDGLSGGAALTVWNFQKAGARVSVLDEALNQIVGGHRGTLALNVSRGYKNAMWKLAWWNAGVGYELYVPEALDAKGLPTRRSGDTVHIGATLARQVRLTK